MTPGIIYVVALPIGNPEDITLRALRVLRSVDFVVAETRTVTVAQLARYGILTSVRSYNECKSPGALAALLADLKSGQTAALVCDAGTPLIADPGSGLVHAAIAASVAVAAVPGASAALAALMCSGASVGRFAFEGFPPRDATDRLAYFATLVAETRTLVLYEGRRFLLDTLRRLAVTLGDQRCVLIAQDLTTSTENLFSGTLSRAIQVYRRPCRGEYAIVIPRCADQGERSGATASGIRSG